MNLGSISDMNRLPGAIFLVDIVKEKIALLEAKKLGIPTFAMVDTNSDPTLVDFPIPSNDDASKSIDIILSYVAESLKEAFQEREIQKKAQSSNAEKKEKNPSVKKTK